MDFHGKGTLTEADEIFIAEELERAGWIAPGKPQTHSLSEGNGTAGSAVLDTGRVSAKRERGAEWEQVETSARRRMSDKGGISYVAHELPAGGPGGGDDGTKNYGRHSDVEERDGDGAGGDEWSDGDQGGNEGGAPGFESDEDAGG